MTVHLRPVPLDVAQAVVAGDLSGVVAAPGWPHADTLDALRMYAASDGAPGTWFVVETETLRVVGECGWYGPPGDDGDVEIGYGLAGPSRGRGYGARAVGDLVAWASEQPGVRRVTARTDSDNTPSRRLLERLGFALDETEGTTVRYTKQVDQTT